MQVQSDGRVVIADEALVFLGVMPSDEGVYYCNISSPLATRISPDSMLRVFSELRSNWVDIFDITFQLLLCWLLSLLSMWRLKELSMSHWTVLVVVIQSRPFTGSGMDLFCHSLESRFAHHLPTTLPVIVPWCGMRFDYVSGHPGEWQFSDL